MPDLATIVDLRKKPHAAALPISGGQGVAGSNPVVPTNTRPADDGQSPKSAGLFSSYSGSFWVGDHAWLGTIWGPPWVVDDSFDDNVDLAAALVVVFEQGVEPA